MRILPRRLVLGNLLYHCFDDKKELSEVGRRNGPFLIVFPWGDRNLGDLGLQVMGLKSEDVTWT